MPNPIMSCEVIKVFILVSSSLNMARVKGFHQLNIQVSEHMLDNVIKECEYRGLTKGQFVNILLAVYFTKKEYGIDIGTLSDWKKENDPVYLSRKPETP